MNLESWRFVGSLAFSPKRSAQPQSLFRVLTRSIVRVRTRSTTRNPWRRAAYMRQIANQSEISNHIVPLNQYTIFRLSSLPDSYTLTFQPVPWLPDLTIQVWEYAGEMPDFIEVELDP